MRALGWCLTSYEIAPVNWLVPVGARQRGKLLGVALWESEEAMHSTEEVVSGIRGGISHPLGAAAEDEQTYEAFILEVPSLREG